MRRGRGRQSSTILIAEDRRDEREMYAGYFAAYGFSVLTAVDGVEALRLAHATSPDIIVTDLAMPHLDGWEMVSRLKSDPATARIPVIACSARVLDGAAERALVAGCNSYVPKPCLPGDLLAEVRRVLQKAS